MFNASNEELFYEMLCNDSFSGMLGILECSFGVRKMTQISETGGRSIGSSF